MRRSEESEESELFVGALLPQGGEMSSAVGHYREAIISRESNRIGNRQGAQEHYLSIT
jgi:hypothetical protein